MKKTSNRCREEGETPKTLRTAVNLHCRHCLDVHGPWSESNDCLVLKCWLYPYRPGNGGPDRVVRKKSARKGNLAGLEKARKGRLR